MLFRNISFISLASISEGRMSVKRNFFLCGGALYFLCVVTQVQSQSTLQRLKLSQRIIATRLGKLRGVIVDFPAPSSLRDLDAYIGVHYGKLINNDDRFAFPRRLSEHWDITDTLHPGPLCPQSEAHSRTTSALYARDRKRYITKSNPLFDDCLYLNVFAPVQGKRKIMYPPANQISWT